MVLRVVLEVVNVHGGQAGDEQLQLLLVEDGDESFGDDVIEALQEGVQLFADGPGHTHLTHQFDVLLLDLLGHRDVTAVRSQVARLRHAKLLDL